MLARQPSNACGGAVVRATVQGFLPTDSARSLLKECTSTTPQILMSNMRYGSGGGIYRIVTTTAQTGGIHFALDCTEKPGGGPPLHIHETEEEYFFVTEGEFTFFIDGKITKAKAALFREARFTASRIAPTKTPGCWPFLPPATSRVTLTLAFPWRMAAFPPKPASSNELTPSDQNSMSYRSRALHPCKIRNG